MQHRSGPIHAVGRPVPRSIVLAAVLAGGNLTLPAPAGAHPVQAAAMRHAAVPAPTLAGTPPAEAPAATWPGPTRTPAIRGRPAGPAGAGPAAEVVTYRDLITRATVTARARNVDRGSKYRMDCSGLTSMSWPMTNLTGAIRIWTTRRTMPTGAG
jgi:hypothetical protein